MCRVINLAVDQPGEIGDCEIRGPRAARSIRTLSAGPSRRTIYSTDAQICSSSVMRLLLMRQSSRTTRCNSHKLRQLPHGLIHEHRAAVHRRANRDTARRTGRAAAPLCHVAAKVSRKWPPSGRRKASVSEIAASARARGARHERSRKLQRGARDAREAGALRRIAEQPAQHRAGPGEAEMRATGVRHSWMFFQVNSRKFFLRTAWM